MIGATAKAEQFQSRSGSESTKGSRKGFSLLGGGENPVDHLTDEEKRASLVAVWKALQPELADAKLKKDPARVKRISVEIAQVGLLIHAIRPKRRSALGLSELFIDICREQMTKPQFNLIMDEANRRQRAAQGEPA